MKKVLLSAGLFLSVFSQAQNYLHQAIILNEGLVSISKIASIFKTFTIVSPLLVYAYSRFLN